MIEEQIQKLTEAVTSLAKEVAAHNQIMRDSQALFRSVQASAKADTPLPAPAAAVTEPAKPRKERKAPETPAAPAAVPAPVAPEAPKPAEPVYPSQSDVIDAGGRLMTAAKGNDGGFLRNLAKELGLEKLRFAAPEQRAGIIERINTEIKRITESAV